MQLGLGIGIGRNRPLTTPFSPEDLATLTVWLAIQDLSVVGLTASWVARGSAALTFAAAGSARPTYDDDDGDGVPSLKFDGVDDKLQTGSTANTAVYGADDSWELWFLCRGVSGSALLGLYGSGGISQAVQVKAQNTPRILFYTPGGNLTISNAVDIMNDTWRVVRVTQTGATRAIYVDGTLIGNAATAGAGAAPTGNDLFAIGASDLGVSEWWNGGFRHFLVFSDLLSAGDAADLLTYLQDPNAWV